MVYEEEPYLRTYLSRWLQAIQLCRPARGVTKATPDILEHVGHWHLHKEEKFEASARAREVTSGPPHSAPAVPHGLAFLETF